MYVVAGVTGNTGRAHAEGLLSRGKLVRVIVHGEAKGPEWKAKGAEVAAATLEDAASVTRALTGATGAYFLIPPQDAAPDLIVAQHPSLPSVEGQGSRVRILLPESRRLSSCDVTSGRR